MITKVKNRLKKHRVLYTESGIPHGIQLKLANGATVNVYNTNKVLVQGRQDIKKATEILLGLDI